MVNSTRKAHNITHRDILFNIFIIFLILISLVILVIDLFVNLTPEQYRVLLIIDWFVILMFAVDLVVDYRKLKNKKNFLKYYWLDVLAVIPAYSILRAFKVMKLFRIFRFLEEEDKLFRMRHIIHLKKIHIFRRTTSKNKKISRKKK